MNVFDSKYYKLNKISLSCIGRWIYQTGLKKRIVQVLIVISLLASLISQGLYVYSVRNDIDAVLEWAAPFFIVLGAMFTLCILIVNEKQIRKILDCIKNDWTVWTFGMELEILKAYAEKGRLFTLVYAVNFNGAVLAVVTQSLIGPVLDYLIPLNESRPRLSVFGAKLPLDEDEHFYWFVAFGGFTGFYNCSILMSSQSLYATSVMHASGLFQIIRLSSDIKYCFSPALFITIGINCLVLSTTGVQVLNAIQKMDNVLKFVGYAIGILLNFYLIMLPPEKLLDCSEEVGIEAYALSWYKVPIKSKKLLLLLILQGQKPCRITAGTIYKIDMETFSALLQTSISFFTVLFSMR